MFPPPTTGPQVAARRDDGSTHRASWIAAIAAMVAAVLTVVGTVWGAYQSGEASQRAADKAADAAVRAVQIQLNGDTERSRAEFLRSQRQTLYSAAVEALDDLNLAEVEYRAFLNTTDGTDSELDRDTDLAKKVDSRRAKLNPFYYKVQLLGSAEVSTRFSHVNLTHFEIESYLSDYSGHKFGRKSEEPRADPDDLVNRMTEETVEFVEACRQDVGSR